VIEHKGWGQPEPAHSGWASGGGGGGDEGGYGGGGGGDGGGWERRSDVGIAESAPVPTILKVEGKKVA